ncbi:hypothetical protein JHL18_14880 [Clostridium sp. YIM B02505]|uniref:Lipoprotein n=1 Tax=Clostridium yunnanense TaxID=2800325 RepID=A0ABS1ERF0_9CLOT|nr:hypothetical protein [Clostridium yunnanense]MBK1811904.1 hypothetical protein [Clostridium yunnanense]
MNKLGFRNLLSLLIGITIILLGCTTAFLFQKHLFHKYKNKVRNTINKDDPPNQC